MKPEETISYENEKTSMSGNPEDGIEQTTMGEQTTQPIDSMNRDITNKYDEAFHTIEPYYDLNGIRFEVLRPVSLGCTGQADVLQVTDGNKQYALKLFRVGFVPKQEIMERLCRLNASDFLLSPVSYGTYQHPSTGETQAYSLMPYLSYDTLAQVSINKNEQQFTMLAYCAALCIDLCHKKGFLHRDIKPANFFYYTKKNDDPCVILSDFGVSELIDEQGYCYSRQSGTNTYNAPEVYTVANGMVRLTTKSDFYSLGITLLSVWMGEAKFRAEIGDNESKGRLFDLRHKKEKGELPYPTDMPADLLLLIKGLTCPDIEKRWGIDQISKWYKGELEDNDLESLVRKDVPFVFNEKTNLIAYTPEVLAGFMIHDREYALKILKRGKVSQWLKQRGNERLATEVDDIVENSTSDNDCVMRAVYLMDAQMPYIDKKGAECRTLPQLSKAVSLMPVGNGEIHQPDSDFYCYLSIHGFNELRDECLSIIENNTVDPKWEIVFAIYPMQPFFIYSGDNNNPWVPCSDVYEIADVFMNRNGELTNLDKKELMSRKFSIWLKAHNPDIHDKIEREIGDRHSDRACWCILYNLDLRRSYELTLTAKDKPCHKTIEEIAELMNDNAVKYYCINKGNSTTGKEDNAETFIFFMHNLEYGRLYYYLISKGCFKNQINWIKYCYELNSKTNTKKCGPYYESVATWKTIRGLMKKGNNPRYYFPKSDKYVSDLKELSLLDKKEVIYELEEGYLGEWLCTFFQEDPYADLSKSNAYELLTADFLNFTGNLYPDYNYYKKYNSARETVSKQVHKTKRHVIGLALLKVAVLLLAVLPVLAIIFALIFYGLPFDGNPLPLYSNAIIWLALLFSIPYYLIDSTEGCFTAIIAGAITSLVSYYAFYAMLTFLLPQLSWVLVVLFGVGGFFIIKKCLVDHPIDLKPHKHLIHSLSDFNSAVVQPLFFTFRSNDTLYNYEHLAGHNNYNNDLKYKMGRLLRFFIPSAVLAWVLLFVFVQTTPSLGGKWTIPASVKYEQLKGVWSGTFNGKSAQMEITSAKAKKVKATVSVQFKNNVNQEFIGSYKKKSQKLILNNISSYDGILDGSLTGECSIDSGFYRGTYFNQKTGKSYDFEFKRQQSIPVKENNLNSKEK